MKCWIIIPLYCCIQIKCDITEQKAVKGSCLIKRSCNTVKNRSDLLHVTELIHTLLLTLSSNASGYVCVMRLRLNTADLCCQDWNNIWNASHITLSASSSVTVLKHYLLVCSQNSKPYADAWLSVYVICVKLHILMYLITDISSKYKNK